MLNAEIQSLELMARDLNYHKETLDTHQAQMSSEIVQIKSVTKELQSKSMEYKLIYKKLNQEVEGKVDFDSVVDTTTPVYRQLFNAFTEEQAIDDVLYELVEALGKNVITVESFLTKVQQLSRQQFMLRATVLKCRKRAGLPIV